MWLACNRRSASGRLASNRCRPNPGADEAARHRVCAATAGVSLFPPRRWRGGFPRRLGASFHGGRALTKSCLRASPPCGSGRLRGTGSFQRLIRWNGFSSNGPRAKKSRRNTGFRPCPKIPFDVLVDTAKLRWRIERDYEELKASSASPISKGEADADSITTPSSASPPTVFSSANERRFPPRPRQRQMSRLSLRPKPRGAADPTRTTCRKFDRDDPKATHDRARPHPHALPVLPSFAITTIQSGIRSVTRYSNNYNGHACVVASQISPFKRRMGENNLMAGSEYQRPQYWY